MGLLISWVTLALGLFIADKLIPNFELRGDWKSFALIAAVLGVLHFLIGWLIFVVLAIATLGLGLLFSFVTKLVVTAIVLKIVDALSRRLTIRGFLPAFLAALVLAATSGVVDWLRR
jgi:putative membrane protein